VRDEPPYFGAHKCLAHFNTNHHANIHAHHRPSHLGAYQKVDTLAYNIPHETAYAHTH
jgi:hypothetical protein